MCRVWAELGILDSEVAFARNSCMEEHVGIFSEKKKDCKFDS